MFRVLLPVLLVALLAHPAAQSTPTPPRLADVFPALAEGDRAALADAGIVGSSLTAD